MANITSMFKSFSNFVAKHYGDNPGKMLIHTGVIGWILSSAAQVVAIMINDKISKKDKLYMIPQEIADAGVNIVSFYLVTQSFKSLGSKLVNMGKLLPKSVRTFLVNNKIPNVGKKGFDVLTHGKLKGDLVQKFTDFRDGIDVITTNLGAILSCNIITPLVRNEIAANRQQNSLSKIEKDKAVNTNNPVAQVEVKKPVTPTFKGAYYPNTSFYSSSSLKI